MDSEQTITSCKPAVSKKRSALNFVQTIIQPGGKLAKIETPEPEPEPEEAPKQSLNQLLLDLAIPLEDLQVNEGEEEINTSNTTTTTTTTVAEIDTGNTTSSVPANPANPTNPPRNFKTWVLASYIPDLEKRQI